MTTIKDVKEMFNEVHRLDKKMADIDERIQKLKSQKDAMNWKKRNKLYFEIGKFVFDNPQEVGAKLRSIIKERIDQEQKGTN